MTLDSERPRSLDSAGVDARLLAIALDREGEVPLYRQVYQSIRDAILDGRLPPGARLPSTRSLASDLDVARNTVLLAFEQLTAEGYLQGTVGSGTHVATDISSEIVAARTRRRERRARDRTPRVSARCRWLREIRPPLPTGMGMDLAFTPAAPATDQFPSVLWSRMAAAAARTVTGRRLAVVEPAGVRELRETIATYVGAARGVACATEQIVVVSGAQQALDLVARTLLDPGDTACMEEPGFPGARSAFVASDARLVPVPVDSQGLRVDLLAVHAPSARVVYVSPSHQFPLGCSMSLGRRLELLEWAHETDAWIVEDDYDSEYRHSGQPLTALRGLDDDDRVVYVGTFSKTLFPALRLGYVVLPTDLVDPFLAVRTHADLAPSLLDQLTLARFIIEGHFTRHVARKRQLYRERRERLLEAAHRHLTGLLTIVPNDTGMRLIGWLPEGVDDVAVSEAAARAGVETLPVSAFYLGECPRGGLVQSYGGTRADAIEPAVERLAKTLREFVGTS